MGREPEIGVQHGHQAGHGVTGADGLLELVARREEHPARADQGADRERDPLALGEFFARTDRVALRRHRDGLEVLPHVAVEGEQVLELRPDHHVIALVQFLVEHPPEHVRGLREEVVLDHPLQAIAPLPVVLAGRFAGLQPGLRGPARVHATAVDVTDGDAEPTRRIEDAALVAVDEVGRERGRHARVQHRVEGQAVGAIVGGLDDLHVDREEHALPLPAPAEGVGAVALEVGAQVAAELGLALAEQQQELVRVPHVRLVLLELRGIDAEVVHELRIEFFGAQRVEVQAQPGVELLLRRLELGLLAELVLETRQLLLDLRALLLVVRDTVGPQARADAEVLGLDPEHVDPAHVLLDVDRAIRLAPGEGAVVHVAELVHQLAVALGVGIDLLELLHAPLLGLGAVPLGGGFGSEDPGREHAGEQQGQQQRQAIEERAASETGELSCGSDGSHGGGDCEWDE